MKSVVGECVEIGDVWTASSFWICFLYASEKFVGKIKDLVLRVPREAKQSWETQLVVVVVDEDKVRVMECRS